MTDKIPPLLTREHKHTFKLKMEAYEVALNHD